MKKVLFPLFLIALLMCSCAAVSEVVDVEAILTAVVENIDWEQLQEYAEKGAEALVERYPSLKTLADSEKMKEILKDKGLTLVSHLLDSAEPETQENARKIGEIIKILYPELTGDVDKVLAE